MSLIGDLEVPSCSGLSSLFQNLVECLRTVEAVKLIVGEKWKLGKQPELGASQQLLIWASELCTWAGGPSAHTPCHRRCSSNDVSALPVLHRAEYCTGPSGPSFLAHVSDRRPRCWLWLMCCLLCSVPWHEESTLHQL